MIDGLSRQGWVYSSCIIGRAEKNGHRRSLWAVTSRIAFLVVCASSTLAEASQVNQNYYVRLERRLQLLRYNLSMDRATQLNHQGIMCKFHILLGFQHSVHGDTMRVGPFSDTIMTEILQ